MGDFVQVPLDKESIIQFKVTDVRKDEDTKVESISTIDVDLLTTIEGYESETQDMNPDHESKRHEPNSPEMGTYEITVGEEATVDVPREEYRNIRGNVKDSKGEMIVVVRPVTGDPDVYVSLSCGNDHPDWTNYDVCDQTEGTRIIRVNTPHNNIYIGLHEYSGRDAKCTVVMFHENATELKEKYCGKKASRCKH